MNLKPVPKKRDSLASASFVPYYMPALLHTMSSHAFEIQICKKQFFLNDIHNCDYYESIVSGKDRIVRYLQ